MAGALHLLFVLPSPSPSPTHPVASARRLLSAFTTSQQNAATTVDFASDESRRRLAAEQGAGHLELDLVLASWVEQHVHSMEETNTRTLLQLTSIERRLTSCSSLLSLSGRLQVVNSLITPITTYTMCTIKLHKGVIENIDRARKQCLWRGSDRSKKGGDPAAWSLLQKPKEKGGIGIINLYLQNDTLLLKKLHKFYSKQNVPWVTLIWSTYYTDKVPHAVREVGSFWWKDVFRLSILYRGVARCVLGEGSTVLFWEDLWSTGILADLYPHLFSFVKSVHVSVKEIMGAHDLESIFHLPLTQEAYQEMLDLQAYLQGMVYHETEKDQWIFIWGNHCYTSSRMYRLIFSGLNSPITFKWLWKAKSMPRIKVFGWLLIMDRLNTKDMLQRRNSNVQSGTNCVLCSFNLRETRDHLFFDCEFAKQCWSRLNIHWIDLTNIHERISAATQAFPSHFFMDIFLIAAWELWKLRNAIIFDDQRGSPRIWARNFREQVHLQSWRFGEDKCLLFI